MNKDKLRRLIIMALCCDLGLFSKRLIAPAASHYRRSAHTRRDRHGLFPHVPCRGGRPHAEVLVRYGHGRRAECDRSFFGNGGQHGSTLSDRLHCSGLCHRLCNVGGKKAQRKNAIHRYNCQYVFCGSSKHRRKFYSVSFEWSSFAAICIGRTDKRCSMRRFGRGASQTAAKY